jgi:hypothetical protein
VTGPLAESFGAVDVLVGGAALAILAQALGLLPREMRMLERLGDGPPPTREVEGARHGHGHRS